MVRRRLFFDVPLNLCAEATVMVTAAEAAKGAAELFPACWIARR